MGHDGQPALLVNPGRAVRNIERMAIKARRNGVRFRPHFKTHQSATIGEWFRPYGVTAITVSSVSMAEYFAGHGWDDIVVSHPVDVNDLERVAALSRRIHLGLVVESSQVASALADRFDGSVELWIDVDTGYHRSGVAWDDAERLAEIARTAVEGHGVQLAGLLTHAGHAYRAADPSGIHAVWLDTSTKAAAARDELARRGYGRLRISVGDTPTCSVVEDLSAVDEIRPGNFVFYDVTQLALGSCDEEDVAVALACSVIGANPTRSELLIGAGAAQLSLDALQEAGGHHYHYGWVVPLTEQRGWGPTLNGARVVRLSQEVGVVRLPSSACARFRRGDRLGILPVHSCLTVCCMRGYTSTEGDAIAAYAPPLG